MKVKATEPLHAMPSKHGGMPHRGQREGWVCVCKMVKTWEITNQNINNGELKLGGITVGEKGRIRRK